jgi:hypothetical protein
VTSPLLHVDVAVSNTATDLIQKASDILETVLGLKVNQAGFYQVAAATTRRRRIIFSRC